MRTDFAMTVTAELERLTGDVFRMELDRDADPDIVAIRRRLERLRHTFDEHDRIEQEQRENATAVMDNALAPLLEALPRLWALADALSDHDDVPSDMALEAVTVTAKIEAAAEALEVR